MGRRAEIAILAAFETPDARSAADIVSATGLPRSTVFRALRSLVGEQFIQQDARSKRYVLGPRILQLGDVARQQLAPHNLVAPPLLELARLTHETVTFSLVDVPWRLCVFVVDAPSDLRSVAQAGVRYALHVGGSSSAILAHLPHDVIEAVLRFHDVPEAERASISAHLKHVREDGVSVSIGQRVAGASSIAAPVFQRDTILGSVAVAGPTERMAPHLEEMKPRVKAVAVELSNLFTAL